MAYNAIFKRFRRISQFQIRYTQSNHFNSGIHHTATKSQFQIHSQGTSSGLYLPDLSRCPAQAVRNRSDNRRGVSSPYSLIVSSVSAGYIKSRSTKSSGVSSPFSIRHWLAYLKPAQAVILQSCHPEQVCRSRCCHASAASHPRKTSHPKVTSADQGIILAVYHPEKGCHCQDAASAKRDPL